MKGSFPLAIWIYMCYSFSLYYRLILTVIVVSCAETISMEGLEGLEGPDALDVPDEPEGLAVIGVLSSQW